MSELPRKRPEIREVSSEESNAGIILEPNETVTLDIPFDERRHDRPYYRGNGQFINGQLVSKVTLGGIESNAVGSVIATVEAGEQQNIFILPPTKESEPIVMPLVPGEMWLIGRGYEGQQGLPVSVSRDHCAIGLDVTGQLLVENHNPSNYTEVQTFNVTTQ
jgi:hypothetical protein